MKTWRPCWLCHSFINPYAPSTSAAAGVRVWVNDSRVEHVHDFCLALHVRAAGRPEWQGRLSSVTVLQVLVIDEKTADRIADRITNPRPPTPALRALFKP